VVYTPDQAKRADGEPSRDFKLNEISQRISRKVNTAQVVAEGLRKAIVRGELKPQERILESKLAADLGLGQPTVREALVALEHEGLITRYPNRGCRVVALSKADIDQIFRIRVELEPLAARLAMENGVPRKPDKLVRALEGLKAAANERNAEKYYHSDLQFHMALWSLATNPYLERVLARLVVPLFAFTMLQVAKSGSFDFEGAKKQHERIAHAVIRGTDAEEATGTVRAVLEEFWQQGLEIIRVNAIR
jgi:DNA-binding GntR family transcriptional regulator